VHGTASHFEKDTPKKEPWEALVSTEKGQSCASHGEEMMDDEQKAEVGTEEGVDYKVGCEDGEEANL
jgi:hypothetical protein